jgi:hypothetical protein
MGQLSIYPIRYLKHLLPNPWKGAQGGNDHKDVCDQASSNHSRALNGAIPYDTNNLEHEPAEDYVSPAHQCDVRFSYPVPESAHPE